MHIRREIPKLKLAFPLTALPQTTSYPGELANSTTPPRRAWKRWRKCLLSISSQRKLLNPLGPWLKETSAHWEFFTSTRILNRFLHKQLNQWKSQKLMSGNHCPHYSLESSLILPRLDPIPTHVKLSPHSISTEGINSSQLLESLNVNPPTWSQHMQLHSPLSRHWDLYYQLESTS